LQWLLGAGAAKFTNSTHSAARFTVHLPARHFHAIARFLVKFDFPASTLPGGKKL
jgi:hypothetical protein